MSRSSRWQRKLLRLALGCLIPVSLGCGSEKERQNAVASPLVASAQEFRSLMAAERYDAAQALMAPEPRRWWNERQGEGQPWKVGSATRDPWTSWDEHFRGKKEILEWKEGPHSVTTVVHETNDYFQLLERGWVTTEIIYYFDGSGKIDGRLIRPVGERPPGRTEEFLAWARIHDADELAALMPDNEVDPSGDHPQRFRRLLNRWRRASGLETIE